MGNAFDSGSHCIGHTVAHCGCMNVVGFDKSAEAVIRTGNIEPWPAKTLIRERLEHQSALAATSPLKNIPVQDGFAHVSSHIGRFSGLTRAEFIKVVVNLIQVRRTASQPVTYAERDQIEEIFDSIDFDENDELSVGEWAGGLTVFFKGTPEEKTNALFQLLDRDGNGSLSKSEMQEYVTPLVKAMTPPEAAALRPLLITHATDTIFDQVDCDHNGKCDSMEFNRWRQEHSLVEELVTVIEGEVYKIWLDHNMMDGH